MTRPIGDSPHHRPPSMIPHRIREMHLEILFALMIATAVTSAWRGAWVILDAALLPHLPVASAGVSLGIGAFLVWLTTMLQPCLFEAARKYPSHRLWIMDALFSYVGFWCCVLTWRGVWQLWDHALALGVAASTRELNWELERSGWLSHGVGTVALLLLNATRSLNAPPMIYISDSSPPFLGARSSPAWGGLLRIGHYLHVPDLPKERNDWRVAVGLPAIHAETVF